MRAARRGPGLGLAGVSLFSSPATSNFLLIVWMVLATRGSRPGASEGFLGSSFLGASFLGSAFLASSFFSRFCPNTPGASKTAAKPKPRTKPKSRAEWKDARAMLILPTSQLNAPVADVCILVAPWGCRKHYPAAPPLRRFRTALGSQTDSARLT